MEPLEIARLEEHRQAKSTAELVDQAQPIAGGWMAYGGPNSWANQACGLGLAGEIASLSFASVLPSSRRRGVQAALILRRLEQTRTNGCVLGIIHSAPGVHTERNALRLGFQVGYTKVIKVLPRPGLTANAY